MDTSIGGVTVADQFLMITYKLASAYLYGIGENTHKSFVHDMNYKMWPIFARDQPPGDVKLELNRVKLTWNGRNQILDLILICILVEYIRI